MPDPDRPVLAAVLCLYRTLLGALLLILTLNNILPSLRSGVPGEFLVQHLLALDAGLHLGANALMAMAGLWLLFGVRTRVVAALAAALVGGLALLLPAFLPATGEARALALAAAVLALPLVVFGGGRWSSYRRGWRAVL